MSFVKLDNALHEALHLLETREEISEEMARNVNLLDFEKKNSGKSFCEQNNGSPRTFHRLPECSLVQQLQLLWCVIAEPNQSLM